jgi:hypothetical protein
MKSEIRTIELPKVIEPRGNLTFIESSNHIPFDISRVYYLYDIPAGAWRGGHAHRDCHELLVAASGSFTVKLHDGTRESTHFLNYPAVGLYVPNIVWRELCDFSSGAVCLVLASHRFDEADYVRDFDAFMAHVRV